jgi:hypothetical protein
LGSWVGFAGLYLDLWVGFVGLCLWLGLWLWVYELGFVFIDLWVGLAGLYLGLWVGFVGLCLWLGLWFRVVVNLWVGCIDGLWDCIGLRVGICLQDYGFMSWILSLRL